MVWHLPRRALALLILAPMIAGCTTDPGEAGFFSGIYNAATGRYEEDAAALEAQAVAAEGRRSDLRAEAARLDAELARLGPEERQRRQDLARLNRELADQSERLGEARADEAEQRRQLEQLRAREEELSRRQLDLGEAAPGATFEAEIEALERDNAQLQHDIDAFFAALE